MVKILVTGGNGQVAQALRQAASGFAAFDVVFLDAVALDITNPDSVRDAFLRERPAYVVNTAAYTAVDKAESEPEKAAAVNAIGPGNLAVACRDSDAVLLHLSTDFVFDGTKREPYLETDVTAPGNVYGITKRDGEEKIRAEWGKHIIVRTSWVYSEFGHNFLKTMLRLVKEREILNIVDDQIGTPTNAHDLAHAIWTLITAHGQGILSYGLYHFSNGDSCSWFGFANAIFRILGISTDVRPVPTSFYPTPAKRPAYSVLSKQKIQRVPGIRVDGWEESLERFLSGSNLI